MIIPLLSLSLAIHQFDNFLFDLDGVIRVGPSLIPDAIDFIQFLEAHGKKVLFVTNNGWKRSEDLAQQFRSYGLSFVTENSFIQPIRVAISYFKEHEMENSRFYYLGPPDGRQLLQEQINASFINSETPHTVTEWDFERLDELNKEKPDAVIVDSYVQHTMESFARLINYVSDPSIQFFGFSADTYFRGPFNLLLPDSGSVISFVEQITDRKAVIMGKPSTQLGNYLRNNLDLIPKRTIMFGDNLATDMKLANINGFSGCLMFTGVHNMIDVQKAFERHQTDFIPSFYGNFTLLMEESRLKMKQ